MRLKIKSFLFSRKVLWLLAAMALAIILIPRVISNSKNKSVATSEIKKGKVEEELILSGEVKADKFAELYFQSSGKIAWIGVEEGQKVVKGQTLAKLDTVKLSADLQRAYADLREAQATLDKVHDDVKGHSADETFTQRESRTTAEVANDKAYDAVTKAQEDLRNATLYAPFPGIVSFVANSSPGINIIYTQKQLEVVDPSTLYFEVSADQTEVTSLALGKKVTVVLDSFGDEEFGAEVAYIGYTPKTGETGTVYKIKVILLESLDSAEVRVGMTGDAVFILSEKEDVLYVAPKFLNTDSKGTYLKVGSPKNKVYIETGLEGEEKVEVVGNLKEGQLLYD